MQTSPTFVKFTFQGPASAGPVAVAGLLATDVLLGFEEFTNLNGSQPFFSINTTSEGSLEYNGGNNYSGTTFTMIVIRWP